MLSSAFIAAANHLLGDARWARERLAPHAGANAQLIVGQRQFGFSIDTTGYLCECASGHAAQVTIQLPMPTLAELTEGVEVVTRRARINGEVEMADALGFVFRNLRWDLAGDLAKLLGDVPAHRLHGGLQRLIASQRKSIGAALENAREYVAEGHTPALSKSQWERRSIDLSGLRDNVARLDKRISRLERIASDSPD